MHERSFVVLEGVIDMYVIYLFANGLAGLWWLQTVRTYFARRPQLNPALQTMPPRRRDLVALSTVVLGLVAVVPLFTEWMTWWEKVTSVTVATVGCLVGFFFVRSAGERKSHRARRAALREADRIARIRLAARGE